MKKMTKSVRSSRIGGLRGGLGGGYEQTDPDYDIKRIQRMRAEYLSLEPSFREMYLSGLSRFERIAVVRKPGEEGR